MKADMLHAARGDIAAMAWNEVPHPAVLGRMHQRTPDLDEQLDRLEGICPVFLAKFIHFLREPGLRWLRLSVGILLIIRRLLVVSANPWT